MNNLFSYTADYSKIDLVLSKMSKRAQSEIKITDREAFLDDLYAALDAESNYNQKDLSLYFLIDKKHYAESTYVPKKLISLKNNDLYNVSRNDLSLREDVEENLRIMSEAALKDGIKLMVSSTYRSYEYQEKLFARWVAIDGLEEAERESARAGTSQHQLGSAIDFGSVTSEFIYTKMGKWLSNNAASYGWSLSFPKNYEDITGYRYECWHYRYIGVPACKLQQKWFCNVQQYTLEFIDLWKNL